MANRRRGEVALSLGGRRFTLCFTLGALAEIEAAFGAADLPALAERFAAGRLAGRDLVTLLTVALRGGGHAIDEEAVRALPLAGEGGMAGLVAALAEALALAFGEVAADPPRPQDATAARRRSRGRRR